MITVMVSYQVNPGFVQENKNNIHLFLADLKKLDTSAFQYTVYTKQDGVTFVHHSVYKNEEIQKAVLNTPSFVRFQQLRDESGLNGTHQVEVLSYVASSQTLL